MFDAAIVTIARGGRHAAVAGQTRPGRRGLEALGHGRASAFEAGRPWRGPVHMPGAGSLPAVHMGDLEVRLATDWHEVRRAQRIRFKVFFEHGSARPTAAVALWRRDLCPFDAICDHLVVVDRAATDRRSGATRPRIVGTYRLLRAGRGRAPRRLLHGEAVRHRPAARPPSRHALLELGHACVLPRYRAKRTIELLWRGIWTYVQHHAIDMLIGCASFDGTDIDALPQPLSALRHFAAAAPVGRRRRCGRAPLLTW